MGIYVDTEPSIIPLVMDVPASLFTAQNQSVQLTSVLGIGQLRPPMQILGVRIVKVVPFDANSVEFGHGAVAAQRNTLASAEEVAATEAGVSLPTRWADVDGYAGQLLTGNRHLTARLGAGSVPSTGLLRLVLLTYHPSPRSDL